MAGSTCHVPLIVKYKFEFENFDFLLFKLWLPGMEKYEVAAGDLSITTRWICADRPNMSKLARDVKAN